MPACAPAVSLAAFAVDAVAHDARSGEVHLVEGLAAIVLIACDEGASRAAVVADIVELLGVTHAEAEASVAAALDRLGTARLLA